MNGWHRGNAVVRAARGDWISQGVPGHQHVFSGRFNERTVGKLGDASHSALALIVRYDEQRPARFGDTQHGEARTIGRRSEDALAAHGYAAGSTRPGNDDAVIPRGQSRIQIADFDGADLGIDRPQFI